LLVEDERSGSKFQELSLPMVDGSVHGNTLVQVPDRREGVKFLRGSVFDR
jgi:hypothetical protein